MPRSLILLRHGESTTNIYPDEERVFCGQLDVPLTEQGRLQALTAGHAILQSSIRIDAIWTSTLQRAVETAKQIHTIVSPQIPLFTDPDLRERSLGDFEGKRVSEVYASLPHFQKDPSFNEFGYHPQQKAPGGENLTEVRERLQRWCDKIRMSKENVLVVSHAVTIRCLLSILLNAEMIPRETPVPNANPLILTLEEDEFLVAPAVLSAALKLYENE